MTTVLGLLGSDSVDRYRAVFTDDGHGNTIATSWTGPVRITPATVNVNNTTEVLGGRDTIMETATVHLPVSADVLSTDQIEWRGHRYDIDGEPEKRTNRFAPVLAHLEVAIIRRR